MGINKLAVSCIIGILLGFLVPFVLPLERGTTLMIGMVAGLGVGYLLDKRDEQNGQADSLRISNRKAQEANRLMERARAGLEDESLRMDDDTDFSDLDSDDDENEFVPELNEDPGSGSDFDADAAEEAQKLSQAEELLRKAREQMNK